MDEENHHKTYAKTVGIRKPSRMIIPPEEVNGKTVVKYQSNDVILGIKQWRWLAVGYVMALNPNFLAIERFVKARWGDFGFEKASNLHLECSYFSFVMKVVEIECLRKDLRFSPNFQWS
ncbi:hypothetical protein LIER_15960 [Lithospermum erythrorhizon]|uniref:Uncharacterized protein n=1 Tax=Lithospermum erythrorhizon TaxID=34254 RepID=A0AAV3Q4T0_LITER